MDRACADIRNRATTITSCWCARRHAHCPSELLNPEGLMSASMVCPCSVVSDYRTSRGGRPIGGSRGQTETPARIPSPRARPAHRESQGRRSRASTAAAPTQRPAWLTEPITGVHEWSRGTYGARRVCAGLVLGTESRLVAVHSSWSWPGPGLRARRVDEARGESADSADVVAAAPVGDHERSLQPVERQSRGVRPKSHPLPRRGRREEVRRSRRYLGIWNGPAVLSDGDTLDYVLHNHQLFERCAKGSTHGPRRASLIMNCR